MNWFARMTAPGVRRAWSWWHRNSFRESFEAQRPRLLVDVSAVMKSDAQTGIQRVVRAVWSELNRRKDCAFEVVPVYASHDLKVADETLAPDPQSKIPLGEWRNADRRTRSAPSCHDG